MTIDLSFDTPNLVRAVEALSPEAIDSLPFGVVKLDTAGKVLLFNRGEAEVSGYGARPAVGLRFFTDIAPCMNTPKLKGRIDAAIASGRLDAEFTHIGDFNDADRELTIRAHSASDGGIWLFTRREGD